MADMVEGLYNGSPNSGKTFHKNIVYNIGFIDWIYQEAVPLSTLFNVATVDGNIATAQYLYPTSNITEADFKTIQDGCPAPTEPTVECFTGGEWKFPITKEFERFYKAYKCSVAKLESKIGTAVFAKYRMEIETKLIRAQIKWSLAKINAKPLFDVSVDMNAQPDVLQAFEELKLQIEEDGFNVNDFIYLVAPRVAHELVGMNIACCNLSNLRDLTQDNNLQIPLIKLHATYFPTGVNVMAYLKEQALFATSCENADIFEATELKLKGWTIYHRYQQFDFEYIPIPDYYGNLTDVAGLDKGLGYLGYKANYTV